MSTQPSRTISVEEQPAAADVAFIRDQLLDFNRRQAGDSGLREFAVFARDGEGKIIGGLVARLLYQWMYICEVYVVDPHRRAGLGAQLLRMAEEHALRQGCHSAYLCTFGWQARPFYERFGYTIFGQLEGWPRDEKRYFLRKRLQPECPT